MKSLLTGLALLFAAGAASASPQATEFGIRLAPVGTDGRAVALSGSASPADAEPSSPSASLSSAVAVASKLGRVTSTIRSAARNRAVRGAANSYHLRGQALDVVPGAGVRHTDIEVALRRAGFRLVESLDEGDHSHFAFDAAPARPTIFQTAAVERKTVARWRMVTAPEPASR